MFCGVTTSGIVKLVAILIGTRNSLMLIVGSDVMTVRAEKLTLDTLLLQIRSRLYLKLN